jgi:alpha-tubulin suppressor-like RCC1 family protein
LLAVAFTLPLLAMASCGDDDDSSGDDSSPSFVTGGTTGNGSQTSDTIETTGPGANVTDGATDDGGTGTTATTTTTEGDTAATTEDGGSVGTNDDSGTTTGDDGGTGTGTSTDDPTDSTTADAAGATDDSTDTTTDGTTDPDPPGSATIGTQGGTVTLGDVTLTIPPGALTTDTLISISFGDESTIDGYTLFSPVYRFEPAGLTFAKPVTFEAAFEGDASVATVFWSRTSSSGFDRLGGSVASGTSVVSTQITHFSQGFVGNGVVYVDPPDTDCLRTVPYDLRIDTTNSAVALFFGVEDCSGRPVTQLAAADFVVREDGGKLSTEAVPTLLTADGLQVFLTLSLDLSGSTQPLLPELIDAAKAFVDRVEADQVPAQIAVEVFAGMVAPVVLQTHTRDLAVVRAQLDALANYTPADVASTNLNGAIVDGVANLGAARDTFETLNQGGALTRGYLVIFTDGADTAGYVTSAKAKNAHQGSTADELLIMGVQGEDYDDVAIANLAPDFTVTAPSVETLARDFGAVANRIAGQSRGTYVLGYCSPKRAGTHDVEVTIKNVANVTATTAPFDATGFGPGCSAAYLVAACDGRQCGGLVCGACDDRIAACSTNFEKQGECTPYLRADAVAAGSEHSCVWMADGTAQCWGRGTEGELGTGTNVTQYSAVSVSTLSGIAQIVVGKRYTLARLTDGTVKFWGYNAERVAGDDAVGAVWLLPQTVTGLTNVAQIASRNYHGCARLTGGTVKCWGSNNFGQVGDGKQSAPVSIPVTVPGVSNAVEIVVGEYHSCARLSGGTVKCWGNAEYGQGGNGLPATLTTPVTVSGVSNAAEVAAAGYHACARLADGTVKCWGNNFSGQLGDGTKVTRTTPVAVTNLSNVAQLATGLEHTCARLTDGTVRCWGNNASGQLGDGTKTDTATPVTVKNLSSVAEITAGERHTCARLTDRQLKCWGKNEFGQLGDGGTTDRSEPAALVR